MVTADWSTLVWVQVRSPIPYSLGAGWVPKAVPTGDPTCTQASVVQSAATIRGCGQQLHGTQRVQPSQLTRGGLENPAFWELTIIIIYIQSLDYETSVDVWSMTIGSPNQRWWIFHGNYVRPYTQNLPYLVSSYF